jgi:hypothetical protein
MEAACSCEMLGFFQTTYNYNPKECTLQEMSLSDNEARITEIEGIHETVKIALWR